MNLDELKRTVAKLERENNILEMEVLRLKMELQELQSEWVHPKSCLHISDPWKEFK